ncbi:hypothetical protein CTEN210_06151 [Chaetoceros tenuissimus]|uniref:Uncharacterized protein n=1 Tax=Chaetoceros tenuissimus TaxID=426638 RepID=A0AAD3CRE1_9STRA|nr:hypothetical protein CTEN210_06151 [Chaetoceros tenuissimus]
MTVFFEETDIKKAKSEEGNNSFDNKKMLKSSMAKKKEHDIFLSFKEMLTIVFIIIFTIVTVNPVIYAVLKFLVFNRSHDNNSIDTGTTTIDTKTIPFMDSLTDQDMKSIFVIVITITTSLVGFGLEGFVSVMYMTGEWSDMHENLWKLVNFVFPLLSITWVGLAMSGNFLALPLMVVTIWKFGFPEVFFHLHSGLFHNSYNAVKRTQELLSGFGQILHHHGVAGFIAVLVTGLTQNEIKPRYFIQISLPLFIQHWFHLLKYVPSLKVLYNVLMILSEAWFQWNTWLLVDLFYEAHWIGGNVVILVLLGHNLMTLSGFLSPLEAYYSQKSKGEGIENDNHQDDMNISSRIARMSVKRLSTFKNDYEDKEEIFNDDEGLEDFPC